MSNLETTEYFRRMLHDADYHAGESSSSSFDPRVFWSVNAILITVLVLVLLWCFFGGADRLTQYLNSQGTSDRIYRERVRARRARQEEEKKETPEQRRAKLLESFERNKVHMIVKQSDFLEESVVENVKDDETEAEQDETEPTVEEAEQAVVGVGVAGGDDQDADTAIDGQAMEPTTNVEKDTEQLAAEEGEHNASLDAMELGSAVSMDDEHSMDENDTETVQQEHFAALNAIETGAPNYIKLRTASGKRTVPNCCAVCLCTYEVGESVVWSSNRKCQHAFHEECVIEWLIKMQDGTPCPCCRQEFTDLAEHSATKKVIQPGHAFDMQVIRL